MSNVVAIQRKIPVGRVVLVFQIVALQIIENARPRPLQQRPPQPARPQRAQRLHAGQPRRAGAAKQSEQDGFDLVVGVMRGQHVIPRRQHGLKAGVARAPGRCLGAPVARMPIRCNFADFAVSAQLPSELAGAASPLGALGVQAVVYMNDA